MAQFARLIVPYLDTVRFITGHHNPIFFRKVKQTHLIVRILIQQGFPGSLLAEARLSPDIEIAIFGHCGEETVDRVGLDVCDLFLEVLTGVDLPFDLQIMRVT